MKRPEGFDPPETTPPPRRPVRAPKPERPREPAKQQKARPQKATPAKSTAQPQAVPTASAQDDAAAPRTRGGIPRASRTPAPGAGARADLRRAARERRRFERAEVRRFTRRARTRRLALASVAGLVVTLIALVLTAVYSPLLALRDIRVDGTQRIDAAEVIAAVDDQLGTPLALIDFGRITTALGAFPLIRSYVTETLPPGTLLIHVVERQPVATVASGSAFLLVDPAGVTIQESAERIPGVPLIDLGGEAVPSVRFDAVIEVLLALPAPLLAQVDSVTARSQDDVRLTLAGVGQQVAWGSAEDSAKKATLLAALIAQTDPSRAGLFDVSAPNNGVFRPF